MKTTTIFIIVMILTIGSAVNLPAAQKIVFEDLIRPGSVYVDPGRDYLYAVEFPVINVYTLKDFKPVKKFGSKGEGPGEFLRFARVHFHKGMILVHSQGRLAYFSKDWKFIKEQKVPVLFNRGFAPFGDKMAAAYTAPLEGKSDIGNQIVVLHDWKCEKIKEIFRKRYYFEIGGDINGIYLPETDRRIGTRFLVWKDKIYVEPDDGEDGLLDVYDSNGKKLYTFKHEFEKIKVTEQHKEAAREWFRVRKRRLLEIVKARGWLYWPDYFPAVHQVYVTDDKVYMIPYKKKEGKVQLFVFDLKGKLLRHAAAPLLKENMFDFHPLCIAGGKIYQFTENDDEAMELHVHEIDKLPAFKK